MSITSKRELILERIRTVVIPLINGSGNYNLNVSDKIISRTWFEPTELNAQDYPAIMILEDGMTSFKPMTGEEYTVGTQILDLTDAMAVGLAGFVKVEKLSSNSVGTEINKLMSDIIIAMHVDTRLSGLCDSVVLISTIHSIDFAESEGLGMVLVTFAIKYDFNPNASTPIT